jgi:hypothetical protein
MSVKKKVGYRRQCISLVSADWLLVDGWAMENSVHRAGIMERKDNQRMKKRVKVKSSPSNKFAEAEEMHENHF